MKLLMITRKVDKDDAQAGFTYGWVKKLGERVDQLKVICLEKGNTDNLSDNIEIFSLGKENGKNRIKEFINFQKGALKFIKQVDGVFCHMNPEYTILIAPYAKLFRKKIITWYSHKAINWKVRLINILADKIITPTQEAFGINSKKKKIIGHGIDTDLFKPVENRKKNDILEIISVGRISPIKDYSTLIEAVSLIKDKIDLKVKIIGGWDYKDQKIHLEELKKMIKKYGLNNQVFFVGSIKYENLLEYYQKADLSINLCPTGSPDKAVLEAMACGLPVLVANETFKEDFGIYANKLIFKHRNPEDLSKKIAELVKDNQMNEIGLHLRKQAFKNHNINNLMDKILNVFKEIN